MIRLPFQKLGGIAIGLYLCLGPATTLAEESTQPQAFTLKTARIAQVLTLNEALTLAEKSNPALQAARLSLDIAEADIGIAKQRPNPQLQVQHYFGNIVALGTNHQETLTQQIETDGKRQKRTAVAKAQWVLAFDQYQELLWNIRSQVRNAYIQYAGAKENLLLLEMKAQVAQSLFNIASRRVEEGNGDMSETIHAQLSVSQVEARRLQAITQLKQARGRLNALLGNPLLPGVEEGYDISDKGYFNPSQPSDLIPLPEKSLPDFDFLLGKAKKLRPDLVSGLQQVAVNEQALKLAEAQRIPDVYVSVGYPHLNVKSHFSPSGNRTYFYGAWVQLGIELPIFNRQKYQVLKSRAILAQSRLQATNLEKQIIADIYDAYQGVQGAKANVVFYQSTLLPSVAKVVQLAQENYQEGNTGLTRVLVAQLESQEITQGYIQAVMDFHQAWAELEKSVGMELEL